MNFDNENKNKMYDKIVEAINNYNPTIGMACDYDTFFNIEKRLIVGYSIRETCVPIEFDPSLETHTDYFIEEENKFSKYIKIIPATSTVFKVYGNIPANCGIDEFLEGSYGSTMVELGYEYVGMNTNVNFVEKYKEKCITNIFINEMKDNNLK